MRITSVVRLVVRKNIMFGVGKIAKKLDALAGNRGAMAVINMVIEEYGSVLDLKIDHKNRVIRGSVLLKGDKEPVDVEIRKYRVVNNGNSVGIVIEELETSREWLNAVLKNFVCGQYLPLPAKHAGMMKDFIG